ncbi:MAG TPA: hypothetical protein DEO94_02145 [Cyanobacteria bacterium UBA11991]|nr:hypothetical protein [Cyanobacteria bacterium UBA11991]
MNYTKTLATVLCFTVLSAGCAMADTSFTPLNFDDSNAVKAPATTTSKTVSGVQAKGTDMLDPAQVTGGAKMQDAILQIDNAQVEVRNNLLNYKAKYAEIDARYQSTKAERTAMKKQIQQAGKKIKNLDNAKNKIRKNFERKSNT